MVLVVSSALVTGTLPSVGWPGGEPGDLRLRYLSPASNACAAAFKRCNALVDPPRSGCMSLASSRWRSLTIARVSLTSGPKPRTSRGSSFGGGGGGAGGGGGRRLESEALELELELSVSISRGGRPARTCPRIPAKLWTRGFRCPARKRSARSISIPNAGSSKSKPRLPSSAWARQRGGLPKPLRWHRSPSARYWHRTLRLDGLDVVLPAEDRLRESDGGFRGERDLPCVIGVGDVLRLERDHRIGDRTRLDDLDDPWRWGRQGPGRLGAPGAEDAAAGKRQHTDQQDVVGESMADRCVRGHDMTEENTRLNMFQGRPNGRVCLTCEKLRWPAKLARQKNRSPVHPVWRMMRDRCNNPNNIGYQYYGARGIRVCARWDDYSLFEKDLGPRPSAEHTLDRIDSDGDYTPENCRWATKAEQTRGRKATKLSEVAVFCIRELHRRGAKQKVLGSAFGVDASTISHVVNFKTWC